MIFPRLYLSVTLMLSVAIYISYCVQLYVAVNIMWPGLKKYFKSPSVQDYGEYPFRIFLVIISCKFFFLLWVIFVPYRRSGFF